MLMAGLFWIAGNLFKGATFDLATSTAIFAMITLIETQTMANLVPRLSSRLLTNTFIAVIVSGMVLAMMSNQNLYWWKRNLSFLGTTNAKSAWEFNLTLIFFRSHPNRLNRLFICVIKARFSQKQAIIDFKGSLNPIGRRFSLSWRFS